MKTVLRFALASVMALMYAYGRPSAGVPQTLTRVGGLRTLHPHRTRGKSLYVNMAKTRVWFEGELRRMLGFDEVKHRCCVVFD